MKKILFLAYNTYGIGGTVRHISTLANYFIDKCEVEILSAHKTSEKPFFSLNKNIKLSFLQESMETTKRGLFRRILSRFKSRLMHKDESLYEGFTIYTDLKLLLFLLKQKDKVIFCTIPSYFFVARFLKFRNCKVIAQEHTGFEKHSKNMQLKILSTYKNADIIHCVNAYDQEIYSSKICESESVFIPNVLSSIQELEFNKENIIVSAGRVCYAKNFEFLLKIFEKSRAKELHWKLYIYCSGGEKEIAALKEKALSNKSADNIFILPPAKDIISVFKPAKIFVSSSRAESFGLVTLEAMSCGLPVVATRTVGSSFLVEENQSGFVSDIDDLNGMAEALNALMLDESLHSHMASHAHERAKLFHISSISKQLDILVGI